MFSGQNQDVVPISSYDTAGSFLILGCNNGSIYYIGESVNLKLFEHELFHCELWTNLDKNKGLFKLFAAVRRAEVPSEDEGQ